MNTLYKRRLYLLMAVLITTITNVSGYGGVYELFDPEVEIDGVRYSLNYYKYPEHSHTPDYYDFFIENERNERLLQTRHITGYPTGGAEMWEYSDGSIVPAFEYYAQVKSPNAPFENKYPRYDKDKDIMAQRYPYYRGEVWIQDSVLLPALPNLREKKYYYVCNLDCKFNEELTFIRLPKYASIADIPTYPSYPNFKNCTGLKTVQIGTVGNIDYVFKNCISLETVIFEANPYLAYSFFNCPNIKTVVLQGACPYANGIENFDMQVYDEATLYVREDQMEEARNDKVWGRFKNIRDLEEYVSGVKYVSPDSVVEYSIYDLSGVCVRTACSGDNWREGLPAGMYIVKSSLGTVKKVYIK